MLTTLPGQFGKTAIVLGAGATVGTSLRDSPDRPRPPLDADFFTQIQRLKNPKHKPYVDTLIRFCHEEFGPGWSLGMEQFYNHVWYAHHFRPASALQFAVEASPKPLDVETLFKQVLLAVFEESLYGLHSQNPRKKTCKYHDSIAQMMEDGDSIITFNYDCVMDCSLAEHCPFWRAEHSYAFSPTPNANLQFWRGNARELAPDGLVLLHKLHGSVNWVEKKGEVFLKSRPYTRQAGYTNFYIIPPVISKDAVLHDGVLGKVWRSAADRLSRAQSVVVVGYSFPAADALAQALFSSRAHNAAPDARYLRNVVIANPDRLVRHKIMRIFRQSIGPDTKVLVFNTMEEMNQCIFGGETELT